tara:strand:- start:1378 stop:1659 length:282 start_codon:yes stop_codon:yes gene_type:complete
MKIIKTANYIRLIYAGAPRYQGQQQGDEYNQHSTQERYTDNELVEGEHIKMLSHFFKQNKWEEFERYVEKLKLEGHDVSRINSMVASATRGKI